MNKSVASAFSLELFLGSTSGRAWQRELETYHRNYFILGAILTQSVGLTNQVIIAYQAMQEQMITTMEKLLTEVELSALPCINSSQTANFYGRHTRIVKHINQQVARLLKANHHE